jgi:phage terminase large subunit
MIVREQAADIARLIIGEYNRRQRVKLLLGQSGTLANDPSHPLGGLLLKKARYKVYHGGRGGAKSWGVADALVIRAATGRELILCTREYQNSIADSVHRVIKNVIEKMGLGFMFEITEKSIRCLSTGSEFIFKGLKMDPDGIKSTEGVTIAWVEEAHKVSEASWETLLPTIRKDGSEVWITLNPDDYTDPTYQRFVVNPPLGAIVHQVNFDSNPHFPVELEGERQEALRKISIATNETERARAQEKYNNIWLGKPKRQSEALIFKGKFIIEEFDGKLWEKADRVFQGADFGFANDPNAVTRSFILDNKLYIEYEAGGVGIDIDEMPDLYRMIPDIERWSIKADSARPETISYLKKKGFKISAADKWKGCVEDGIAHMGGFDLIIIHPRCRETANEFENYSYKVDSKTSEVLPIIVDAFNHYIDSIRYALDGYITKKGGLSTWRKLGK